MENFNDLQFVKFLDGVSATVTYGEYELSVVKHSGSYGGKQMDCMKSVCSRVMIWSRC